MLNLLFLAGLYASCTADYTVLNYFYNPAVSGAPGTSFSSMPDNGGGGRIVGIKVWELPGAYIVGMQLKYKDEDDWSVMMGRTFGTEQELNLFDDEVIVQISGKYVTNSYIYQVIFVTSMGRSLIVGQPVQRSFNLHTPRQEAELILLSGNFNGNGITSLGAHWGEIAVTYVSEPTDAG